jgi:hypothetical protein
MQADWTPFVGFLGCLYALALDWQTLIAGLLALIGAWWTIRAMNRHAQEGGLRKARAARALLPATLMAVIRYAAVSVRWLESVKEKATFTEQGQYGNQSVSVNTWPRPDPGFIHELVQCVEYFDGAHSSYTSELLSQIQIQQARIAELHDYFADPPHHGRTRSGLRRDIHKFMADSVKIAALANQLFPYARRKSDAAPAPLDLAAMRSALYDCKLDDTKDAEVWNILTQPLMPEPEFTV